MGVERVDEDRLAVRGALVLHAKLVADGEEELRGRERRVGDERRVDVLREPIEEQTAQRGLADADLSGEVHDAAPLLDAPAQMRERLFVARAEIDEAAVRCVRERGFAEAEVPDVWRACRHAGPAELPGCAARPDAVVAPSRLW